MIVSCESCKSRYKLDDSKITGRGAKITCPKCKHVFVVLAPPSTLSEAPRPAMVPAPGGNNEWEDDEPTRVGREAAAEAAAAVAASRPEPPVPGGHEVVRPRGGQAPAAPPVGPTKEEIAARAATLDFRKVGVTAWKVKVRIGLVYDFSDIKTLRKYIQDGRVTPADVISHDGKTWKPLGEVPDLDAFFCESYDRLATEYAAKPAQPKDPQPAPADLGNVAAELAAAAAAEIDDAGNGRTPTGPVYNDPFEAMKQRQRERGPTRKPADKGKAEGGVNASLIGVFAAVALLGVGAWWYGTHPTPPAPPPVALTPPVSVEPAPMPTPPSHKVEAPVQEAKQADENCITYIKGKCVVGVGSGKPGQPASPMSAGAGDPNPGKAPVVSPSISSSATDDEAIGDEAMKSGDMATALIAYQKAVDSGKTTAKVKLGQAQFQSGDDAGGTATLTAAAKSNPKAYKVLGQLKEGVGDTAGAKVAYTEYLKSNPKDAAIKAKLESLGG